MAVLLIDAADGLTAQDAHVAGSVVEEGKGLVVAVNKWDLVEKTDRTFDEFATRIRAQVPFLDFAPVVSISALTGLRAGRVLERAVDVAGERRKRIPTGELNRVVGEAVFRQTPPPVKGTRPKIFYATQAAVAPPTFVVFTSDAASVHFSYQRYLENRLRDAFGFDGTPIRLIFRDRRRVELERRSSRGGRRARAPKAKGQPPGAREAKGASSRRPMTRPTVAVVGAGAWGTTLALQLARTGPVTLLARDEATRRDARRERTRTSRHLPGFRLPVEVEVSGRPVRPRRCRRDSSSWPCPRRPCGREAEPRSRPSVHPDAVLLSVTKGIERGSLLRMTEVLAEVMPAAEGRIGALSGPNLALEIARGLPASAVVGAVEEGTGQRVLEVLGSRSFRLYTNRDVDRRRALRRAQEHHRHRRRRGRAARLRRQRQGRAHHARPGRDDPPRPGRRRQPADLRRAGRGRRRHRDLRLEPVAQPPPGRGAGQGPHLGGDRGRPARASRRAPTPSTRRSAWRHGWASRCPSPRRSTTRSSRARASSAA